MREETVGKTIHDITCSGSGPAVHPLDLPALAGLRGMPGLHNRVPVLLLPAISHSKTHKVIAHGGCVQMYMYTCCHAVMQSCCRRGHKKNIITDGGREQMEGASQHHSITREINYFVV